MIALRRWHDGTMMAEAWLADDDALAEARGVASTMSEALAELRARVQR